MSIMKRFQKKTICMMGLMMLLLGFASCEKSNDELIVDADSGVITEVPEPDVWVTDDDVKEADLDLLVDLSVKMERVRQEFVKMLSNGGEGDKPFCGVGPKTDVGPTMKLLTDMLGKEEEYEAALGRLDETRVMKPSATRDGWLGDLRDILFTGRAEAKKEQEKVKDVLLSINAYGNADAQKQLYDFYCSQEPEYAKKIGAKDAKDFFNKLNNGELTSYALNISHIWRDKGLLMADQPNNAVGEYATVAFTGHIEYGKSAYRVSSKVAVAAGNLYLSGVDKLAGGWGAKIMEWSDAIGNKITKLKLMRKTLQGKPDWQGWNEYILNSLKDDIKTAIGEAFGDDAGFEKELVDQATEEMLSWVVKQCTENEDDAGDDPEAAEEKKDKLAKEDNLAILNIETDFSSEGKMILITDENTGQVHIGTPTYDGHFSLATTPGTKMITVIKKNGQRLTKRVTLVEGTNNIILKGGIDPYINLNPSNFTLECKAGSETAIVLTNCKYVKLTRTEKLDWCDVQLEINGSAGRGVHVRVNAKANLEDKERQGTFTLEGYKDKNDAKPAVTKTFRYTQDAYTSELTPIGVSPTSLLFDAKGGEKTVKVDIKNYKYCGVTSDEKYDSWLTATANDDATITVKVAPNETGEERTAVIYAFGTDYQNVESLDQVAFKAIPITQSGGGEVVPVGEFVFGDLSVTVKNLQHTTYGNDENSEFKGSHYFGWRNIYVPGVDSWVSKRDDFTLITHSPNIQKQNKDITFTMTQEYKYMDAYEAPFKATAHIELVVHMTASNPDDLSTYIITSISASDRMREELSAFTINDETNDYYDYTNTVEIESEIPYVGVDRNGYHLFRLKGKAVSNAVKLMESIASSPKYNDYGTKMVPYASDENDYIEFRLYPKE